MHVYEVPCSHTKLRKQMNYLLEREAGNPLQQLVSVQPRFLPWLHLASTRQPVAYLWEGTNDARYSVACYTGLHVYV